MARRFRLGPVSDPFTTLAAPDQPPPAAKLDVNITVHPVDVSAYPAVYRFTPDKYDPATHNPLIAVHVVVIPATDPVPTDPNVVLGLNVVKFSVDVSANIDGTDVSVPLVGLPKAPYIIAPVLEDEVLT